MLSRAAARSQATVEAELTALMDRFEKEEKRPTTAELTELVHRWARAQALARLAVEPGRPEDDAPLARTLLAGARADVFAAAGKVLDRPLGWEPPVAYAFFGVPKDATEETLARAGEAFRDQIARIIAEEQKTGGSVAMFEELLDRAAKSTAVLFDATTRAAYDASTCPTPRAEMYRRHTIGYVRIVELSAGAAEEDDPRDRAALATMLAEIPAPIRRMYLPTSIRNDDWVKVMLLRARYSGTIARGWKLLNEGEGSAVVDLCRGELAGARELCSFHRLRAFALLADGRVTVWEAAEGARQEAQAALRCVHWTDPTPGVMEIRNVANLSTAALAQHGAAERALKLVGQDLTRDAILTLWSAYPGHEKKRPQNYSPAGRHFDGLAPRGGGFYAFATARALRANVITWFNNGSPSSHEEHWHMKRYALNVTRIALAWAEHAEENIATDPLRAGAAMEVLAALADLKKALEKDRRMLSS
ncbi:MAG: hypothetical protein QM820_16815 [Minicystis sp.]